MSKDCSDVVGSEGKPQSSVFLNMGVKFMDGDILEKALEWIRQGRRVALATIVETFGSSPLPVGSQLAVDSQGAFEGSVSGGCIEGAVITEALEVLEGGAPREVCFGMGDEQRWETGLSCGGRISIYIEDANKAGTILENVMAFRREERPVCLVTDLATGRKAEVLMDAPERRGVYPTSLRQAAMDALQRNISATVDIDGRKFFCHSFNPALRLIIIGAVHISQHLAKMAQMIGYDVVIIDPREGFADTARFPSVRLERDWPDDVMGKMALHSRTAVAVLTHDPKIDDPALMSALESGVFYIGALGSKRTHAGRLERLKKAGFSEEILSGIHGPIGLSIGARSPAEIAVSILAEITQELHRKTKDKPMTAEIPCCMKDDGPVCNTIAPPRRK
ncbi:XdhC/CoxI family protein [uncultured Desulfobacterium sp.]|uniref:XdhC/CoxI family protein n=1 Tax=uncultured Desulfobacterium sp. TaxID=201089 RepID=A0A445N0M4_9BACT|nr:XdhC/CoxI family protein [uncultured Desulfobacterium sp.]